MEVICSNCRNNINIPDKKIKNIPTGKTASVACPGCGTKNTITISPSATSSFGFDEAEEGEDFSEYDPEEKPFDFIEDEGKTALICEADNDIAGKMVKDLDFMEFHVTVAVNARDALKKMRYHVYDLLIVNESFNSNSPQTNAILMYLERLPMSVRRDIFVMLLSNTYRSMDNMSSFLLSVDMILSLKDIKNFESAIRQGTAEHDMQYRIYRDAAIKAGKA